MRLCFAMMQHETNTLSPVPTDWQRFADWEPHQDGVACSVLTAEAMPSGPAEPGTYRRLAETIIAPLPDHRRRSRQIRARPECTRGR